MFFHLVDVVDVLIGDGLGGRRLLEADEIGVRWSENRGTWLRMTGG